MIYGEQLKVYDKDQLAHSLALFLYTLIPEAKSLKT